MCRALGLLQEDQDSGLEDSLNDRDAAFSRSFHIKRMPSSLRAESQASPTMVTQRKDRFRRRLLGGMDVLQHSNPHLSDVLQVQYW